MGQGRRGTRAWVLVAVGVCAVGCTAPAPPPSGPGPSTAATAVPSTTPAVPVPSSAEPRTPSAGTVDETVAARPGATTGPVGLHDVQRSDGVSVALRGIRDLTVSDVAPGEIGGPALAVTVVIGNGSGRSLDLDSVSVTLTGADGRVATPFADRPTEPLGGTVRSGGSARGTYVFAIARNARSPITVAVSYEGPRTAVFVGDAGRA